MKALVFEVCLFRGRIKVGLVGRSDTTMIQYRVFQEV